MKYAYKAINDSDWPAHLGTETVKQNKILHSNNLGPKIGYKEKRTFQDQAAVLNDLPLKHSCIRVITITCLLGQQKRFT